MSALLPRCLTPERWLALWPELEERLVAFLAELEEISGSRELVRRSVRALERLILGVSTDRGPTRLGSLLAVEIDVTRSIPDVSLESGIDRLLCRVALPDGHLGVVELPACDGLVSAATIADAVASEFAWPILGWLLGKSVYPELVIERGEGDVCARRGETLVTAGLPADVTTVSTRLHDAAGWTVLLQELFGLPDWHPGRFYDWEAAELTSPDPVQTRAVVELSEPLPDLDAPDGALDVRVTLGGAFLGTVRVDARDGIVPAGRLVPAIAAEAGFELARMSVREALLDGPLRPDWSLRDVLAARARSRSGEAAAGHEDELVLARRRVYEIGGAGSRVAVLPAGAVIELLESATLAGEGVRGNPIAARRVRYDPGALASSIANVAVATNGSRPGGDYFDSLFAERADPWDYTNPYEGTKYRQTLDLLPRRVRRALELGCAEGHFTERLAGRVDRLVAADISQIALDRASERCARSGNVEFVRLDVGADPLPGRFDLIVCSEILYYLDSRSELDRVAAELSQALRQGGCLVAAHAHVVSDQPGHPGFAWDVPFGARTIGAALRNAGGLELEQELRTPFYRVQRFRRPSVWRRVRRSRPVVETIPQPEPLPIPVAPTARWEGMDWPAGAGATHRLPILMYHRVASGGSAELGRYRLAPERLDEQLSYLREAGFRSVGFEEVGRALRGRRALPGHAVMLTFDDGCRDFLTEAWPLLRAHGFGATLFVVTDRVGRTNDWDAEHGQQVELLGWEELRRLVRAGVEIGSHTATHPLLTSLSLTDVAREAARSRAAIIRELGVEPLAIAYPYGDVDGAVRHIAGGAGYVYGVTTEGRRAMPVDDPLDLPRVEVTDSFSKAELAEALGLSPWSASSCDGAAAGLRIPAGPRRLRRDAGTGASHGPRSRWR